MEYESFREKGHVRYGNALYLERYLPDMQHSSCWESPESFAKYVESLKPENSWHSSKSAWEKGGDFAGSKSMEETLDMARHGWPEGAAVASKIRDHVLADNPLRKQPIRYGIAGAYPNVPRAVSGNPLSMRMMESASSRKKQVITLISNMTVPWFVTAKTISNRAASVAAVIDQIETAGYCCEVIAIATTASGKFRSSVNIMTKESHQPVDIGRLAFGLGNSSMFRRMVFADWETEPSCSKLGDGLGCCYDLKPSDDLKEKSIFIIPEISREDEERYSTPEKCATEGVQKIIDSLRKQGCPAFR